MKLYVVYDRVSGTFGMPVAIQNDNAAKRAFLSQQKGQPYSDDMELYGIGSYDPDTGTLQQVVDRPVFICRFEEEVKVE